MQREFMEKLTMGRDGERMQAWSDLPLQPEVSHGVLKVEDRQQLHDALRAEEVDGVRDHGILMMLRFGTAFEPLASIGRTLDAWFSRLFQRRSALFGITEENYARRDEDALVHVARRFPPWLFHNTDVQQVPFDDASLPQLLLERDYEAILVMGRLCLFGNRAFEMLHGKGLHLDFPNRPRPARLKRGQLNKKYHCICENSSNEGQRSYQASDNGHERTDYGMVQVYPIFNGQRWITVVMCAGCSSLGTLAAARWLAYDLGRPQDAGNMPIPVPHGIRPQSRMEALVRVTADSTTRAWQPSQIELCRLYVDDALWSPEDSQWHNTRTREVQVLRQDGKPVALFMDGEKAPFRPDSQRFRLAIAVMMGVHESSDGLIQLDALSRDEWIWGGRQLPPAKVKQRLHNLESVLQRTLIIGERVRVEAKVTIVDE